MNLSRLSLKPAFFHVGSAVFLFLILQDVAHACNVRNEDEVVKIVEKKYTVVNPGGSEDHFVYVFTAHFTGCMNQTGRASSLTHPVDTRACFYSLGSNMTREGFYVTGSGRRASLGDVRRSYSNPIRRTDFGSQVFGHSTCGDHFQEYDRTKASIKSQLDSTMETMLMTDILPDSLRDATRATGGTLTPAD